MLALGVTGTLLVLRRRLLLDGLPAGGTLSPV